jgi:hypothetical protein
MCAMMISKGNRSTRRKPAPVPICSPQTPHACPDANPGHGGGKPATNRLSYSTASTLRCFYNLCFLLSFLFVIISKYTNYFFFCDFRERNTWIKSVVSISVFWRPRGNSPGRSSLNSTLCSTALRLFPFVLLVVPDLQFLLSFLTDRSIYFFHFLVCSTVRNGSTRPFLSDPEYSSHLISCLGEISLSKVSLILVYLLSKLLPVRVILFFCTWPLSQRRAS